MRREGRRKRKGRRRRKKLKEREGERGGDYRRQNVTSF